jgi:hypothetical protein
MINRLLSCKHIRSITYCNLNAKKDGHIYVVKEREFIKTNENIYKIGRSKNIVRRMPSYPKDSLIYLILYSPNVVESEKALIMHFDKLFIKRTDIGYEYYEAAEKELMKECMKMFIHNLYK